MKSKCCNASTSRDTLGGNLWCDACGVITKAISEKEQQKRDLFERAAIAAMQGLCSRYSDAAEIIAISACELAKELCAAIEKEFEK